MAVVYPSSRPLSRPSPDASSPWHVSGTRSVTYTSACKWPDGLGRAGAPVETGQHGSARAWCGAQGDGGGFHERRTESSCSYEESRSFCWGLEYNAQASVCHQQWPHFILIQSAIESRNSPWICFLCQALLWALAMCFSVARRENQRLASGALHGTKQKGLALSAPWMWLQLVAPTARCAPRTQSGSHFGF